MQAPVHLTSLSEGNPSEEGSCIRVRCAAIEQKWWRARCSSLSVILTALLSGIRIDAQCALDYVLSHQYLSQTPS